MELPGVNTTQLFCFANDNSPKYPAFRASPLPQVFPVGLHDPLAREASGEAVVVRGAFDRRNENAAIAHLKQVTGRKRLLNMDFNHASATIAVPRGTIQSE